MQRHIHEVEKKLKKKKCLKTTTTTQTINEVQNFYEVQKNSNGK